MLKTLDANCVLKVWYDHKSGCKISFKILKKWKEACRMFSIFLKTYKMCLFPSSVHLQRCWIQQAFLHYISKDINVHVVSFGISVMETMATPVLRLYGNQNNYSGKCFLFSFFFQLWIIFIQEMYKMLTKQEKKWGD